MLEFQRCYSSEVNGWKFTGLFLGVVGAAAAAGPPPSSLVWPNRDKTIPGHTPVCIVAARGRDLAGAST
jgi:hypothetical protein